jgi:iron complex outermembrane receptor protein
MRLAPKHALAMASLVVATPRVARSAQEPASSPASSAEQASAETQTTTYHTTVYGDVATPDGLASQRQLLRRTPGFAHSITIAAEGPAQGEELGSILSRRSGVNIRSLGGLGQFTSVSLRGSSPQQVRLFLDGVPLDGAVAGLTDLSTLPLDGLDTIEVYRGYVPIGFGGAAIGGAIHLVTRLRPGPWNSSFASGIGSFGTREVSAQSMGELSQRWRVGVNASYAGSDGDYLYFDDRGTTSDRSDDRFTRRQNNGYARTLVQARARFEDGPWQVSTRFAWLNKDQQIPGSARNQSSESQQSYQRFSLQTRAQRKFAKRPGSSWESVAALSGDQRHYEDPRGEVGVGRNDQLSKGVDIYGAQRLRYRLFEGFFLGVRGDFRAEALHVDDRRPFAAGESPSARGDATRRRQSAGLGIEIESYLARSRLLIVPALRVDDVHSQFKVPKGEGELNDEGRNTHSIGWSPRVGVRIKIAPKWLEWRMSAGHYFRTPTLMELFGDRGTVVGNEGLKPENGESFDAGLVLTLDRSSLMQLTASTNAFANWSHDLIYWVPAGAVIRPENLVGARILGNETSIDADFFSQAVHLQAAYTFLDTRNLNPAPATHHKALPGRPRHDFFTRFAVQMPKRWRNKVVNAELFATYEAIAGTFLDPSGRYELPSRHLLSAGLTGKMLPWLEASLDCRNLTNRVAATIHPATAQPPTQRVPVADFLGYPLPGRSLWLSVRLYLHHFAPSLQVTS